VVIVRLVGAAGAKSAGAAMGARPGTGRRAGAEQKIGLVPPTPNALEVDQALRSHLRARIQTSRSASVVRIARHRRRVDRLDLPFLVSKPATSN
jgi:hypothetical protein